MDHKQFDKYKKKKIQSAPEFSDHHPKAKGYHPEPYEDRTGYGKSYNYAQKETKKKVREWTPEDQALEDILWAS